MIFYILDNKFDKIGLIDEYESAIWTDRYLEPGDFELYIRIGTTIPSKIAIGRFLMHRDSEHIMVIEELKIETDIEDGNVLIVTGRSIESILDRRIVYNKTVFNDTQVFDAVYHLIAYNALYSRLAFTYDRVKPKGTENPKNLNWYEWSKTSSDYIPTKDTSVVSGKPYYVQSERGKRRCFFHEPVDEYDEEYEIFQVDLSASTAVRNLTDVKITGEYWGEDLLKVITDICKDKKVGFKVIVKKDDRDGHQKMFFSMYKGKDRTDTTKTSYVIFSASFDNLINSNYTRNEKPHKTFALCVGPEEDVYNKVKPKSGMNPQQEGWVVWIDGYNEYVPTEDTTVTPGKTYYVKDEYEKRRIKTTVGDSKKYFARKEVYIDCSSTGRQEDVTYDPISKPDKNANPKEEGWYIHYQYDDPDKMDEYVKTCDTEVDKNEVYYVKNTHTKNDEQFEKLLQQRGKEKLKDDYKREIKFDGEVDPQGSFRYRKHFYIGDVVLVRNEYGFQHKARVTEYIFSDNVSDGEKHYPTFEMEEED